MNILVIGANGPLGRLVIQFILEVGDHRAVALLQNNAQAAYFNEKGIENFIYSPKESIEFFLEKIRNVDAIVIADHNLHDIIPDAIIEIDETVNLLETLKYSKLKRVVHISTFETRKEEWMHLPVYFRQIMIKNYYVDQWIRMSSLDYTIIHPGNLNDKKGTGFVKIVASNVRQGNISREDVAKIVLACLENQSTIRKEFKIVTGKDPIAEAINSVF
ncbi:NAD(P)-binding oxidoreductase [Lysinibacillus sp. SGAir0095]|uniref:NAD(P)-binding oxidoreductase n=1 Tax=Lysinibacillus sp. SGAir0095 TaxID=2070463 RepID=UPI00143D4B37|nr:NAD(P)-binding oxidoreductase [Lysinibacillus sp. SGAir0095]